MVHVTLISRHWIGVAFVVVGSAALGVGASIQCAEHVREKFTDIGAGEEPRRREGEENNVPRDQPCCSHSSKRPQEVVRRFVAQGETYQHLEELKSENEKTLVRLKEEKERLQEVFQELKYSGEAKLSSGQQVLEELQTHLQKEEKRRDKCKEDLERMSKILSTAKSGMEHLGTKVQHIKVSRSHFPARDLSPQSDEYTLDLLETTEKKLQKLLEELDGQDVVAVLKQMEEEEFQAKIEGKLPAYNVRISLPAPTKQDSFEEEEDSGEDEGDVVTRATLKRQSQQIIESKTKRKSRPKKKKGKQ